MTDGWTHGHVKVEQYSAEAESAISQDGKMKISQDGRIKRDDLMT